MQLVDIALETLQTRSWAKSLSRRFCPLRSYSQEVENLWFNYRLFCIKLGYLVHFFFQKTSMSMKEKKNALWPGETCRVVVSLTHLSTGNVDSLSFWP